MAKAGLNLEPEVKDIFELINEGKTFLLSGGAGSGKTYSLVQVIQEVIRQSPVATIACMTYTNAAVREISGRINYTNLSVSTIHDFLWDNIKFFQKELKKSAITLINDPEVKKFKSPDEDIGSDYFAGKEIQYKEYTLMREGIISHDELLILANHMFKTYVKLCDILKDKFDFILLDEYQDTAPQTVEILLDHLPNSSKANTVGFFGDSMQSIYDEGVGDLEAYISEGQISEVPKKQNRRNPRLVYELANKLRIDSIIQIASDDKKAPNMDDGVVKDGDIKFYYSSGDSGQLAALKASLGWDFNATKETKELNLTHNLIAGKAGFRSLMDIYDGDKILDYKKRITDYIKKYEITIDFSEDTFGQVIDKLLDNTTSETEKSRVQPTNGMQIFIDANKELFEEAKKQPFDTFKKIYLDKNALIDDKKQDEEDESKPNSERDSLIKHLFKIQTNIWLYKNKKYNDFLRKTEFKINKLADKRTLKETIKHLDGMNNNTIEEVIDYADEQKVCIKDDDLTKFIAKKKYVYDRVTKLEFGEFQKLFEYLEGRTPFSTQHKIKGAEFNNVLVILDNGNWNNYNFEYLLNQNIFESLTPAKKRSFPKILKRTQKMFYVCCTRAKENLVVYYHQPSQGVLSTARSWFGDDNVIEI